MDGNRAKNICLLAAFWLGFFLGILFINLWGDTYFRETSVLGRETLQKISESKLDTRSFFFYLLKMREQALLLIWLLGYTIVGTAVVLTGLCWVGFAAGVLLTMAVLQLRLTGILLFFFLIFPQVCFYVPAIRMLADGIWERGKGRIKNRRTFQEWSSEKEYIFLLFLSAACVMAGSALESCVNPPLIRWAIKYFL